MGGMTATLDVEKSREKLTNCPAAMKEMFERLAKGGSPVEENVALLRRCGKVLGNDIRLYGAHVSRFPPISIRPPLP